MWQLVIQKGSAYYHGLLFLSNTLSNGLILAIPHVTSMWFNYEFLQGGNSSWDGLVGEALDSQSRGWCKAWVQFPVGVFDVEEADLHKGWGVRRRGNSNSCSV